MFLSDILFPKKCFGCRRLGMYFCHKCQSQLRIIDRDFCPYCQKDNYLGLSHPLCRRLFGLDGLFSFFYYRRPFINIIKNIKYHYVTRAMDDLTNILPPASIQKLKKYSDIIDDPVLTIVPSHKNRIKERGFCHLALISTKLNQYFNFEYNPQILTRIRNTKPQAQLKKRYDRYINIRGAFAINELFRADIKNRSFILFDDVWTSGLTIKESAKVLKNAGAKKILAITLAR